MTQIDQMLVEVFLQIIYPPTMPGDFTFSGGHQACEDPEQAGLARSIRPPHPQQLTMAYARGERTEQAFSAPRADQSTPFQCCGDQY
jgi:hypothetical protein